MDDELRPEYDLNSLQVRKVGPGREGFGPSVRLELDVAKVFPDSEAVNQALRFLIRIARENKSVLPGIGEAHPNCQHASLKAQARTAD